MELKLSEECRAELLRHGFVKTLPAYICSLCFKTPDEMAKVEKHAMQDIYDKAYRQSTNPHTDHHLKKVSRVMHNSSRCCGQPFKIEQADYHLMLYAAWKGRKNIPQNRISGPPIDGIPNMRIEYGPNEMHQDDDFIVMHFILGLPDMRTGDIIKIFREEDIRQSLP